MESKVKFYKEDKEKDSFWLNKEYLVQLNLTGDCPLNCEFCYMSSYKKQYLSLDKIKKLWKNLRKYYKEKGIEYRVNLTGGDIFEHPDWLEIVKFISKEESITAVDPLINKFWNKNHSKLLDILRNKINFVQLNSDVVSEEDIKLVKKIGKKVVLKIALYGGNTKRNIEKLKRLSEDYDNVIISIDLIIPQQYNFGKKDNYLIFDKEKLKKQVKYLRNIFGKKLWLLSTTVKREYLKEVYYCPVPFGGVYIMPNGKIAPCSRYSHLNTGFTIENFDLIKYVKKFNRLCSNFCLFENKYFKYYWDKKENPKFFWS